MITIYDKGNWKNFIGYREDGTPMEVMKCGGNFYEVKFSLENGIIPCGSPLKVSFGKDE